MKINLKKLIPVLILPLFFSGCGMLTQNIAIEYNSKTPKSSINSKKICLNKFTDDRTDKSKIGVYQDGYTVEHNVVTDQNVDMLISNALNDELKQLGYEVDLINIKSEQADKIYDQCNVLGGSIKKVFTEGTNKFIFFDYKSIIKIEVELITKSGKKLNKTYATNGGAKGITISASNSKEAIDEALQKIVIEITKDIQDII